MKGLRYPILMLFFSVFALYGARPFNTDDAGTVSAGEYELEMGCDFWSDQASLGLGFKHGITERMDLGVGLGFDITPAGEERFSGAEFGWKFAIVPDLFSTSITATQGLSAYSLNGIITNCFGPAELDINLGYDATGIQEEAGSISFGIALQYGLGLLDFGLETQGDKDGFQTWLGGVRYHIRDGLAIDVGIFGSFNDDLFGSATAGLHYEF